MKEKQIFKKILVPIDGSLSSLIAQELTAFLAKRLNSEVTVLHVVSHKLMNPQLQKISTESPDYFPLGPAGAHGGPITHVPQSPSTSSSEAIVNELTSWYHQKGAEIVANAVAFFKEKGVPVEEELLQHTDPAETIIKEAEEGKYDLIIMGYSEEEEKTHLGSVAKKVSQHAQTPVLIARNKRKISKMLVPVDGSESAEKALKYAIILAEKTDAKITLLHVQESRLFRLRPDVTKKIGTHILSKAANQTKGTKLDQKLESGDPAKVITQMADKGNYDVIIIGSKGHSTIARFLLGSVSDHVTHYANCSVLITR